MQIRQRRARTGREERPTDPRERHAARRDQAQHAERIDASLFGNPELYKKRRKRKLGEKPVYVP
eukprot:1805020-Prymnesium_polylepis.1